MVETHNPDVIAITETNSKRQNHISSDFNFFPTLANYSCFHDTSGRGVCLFILKNHNPIETPKKVLYSPSVECIIKMDDQEIRIGVAYRSPNNPQTENTKLNKFISSFFEGNQISILMGDFNFPEIEWQNESCTKGPEHASCKFLETIQDNYISQLILEPTHHRGTQKANVLDLVLTKSPDFLQNISQSCPIGKSHHSVIIFQHLCDSPNISMIEKQIKIKKMIMDRGNYKEFENELFSINWNDLLAFKSVDEMWLLITNILSELKEKHIPSKYVYPKTSKFNKSIPKSVLEQIKLKRKTFKMYKNFKTMQNLNAYRTARNQVKWALRKATKDKEEMLAINAKTNPKAFFSYMSSKTKPKEPIPNLKTPENQLTQNDKQKADLLNSYFASVFTKEDITNIPHIQARCTSKLETVEVSEEMIKNKLSKINVNKSAGPDNLHPKLLKELNNVLPIPLKILFDKTIESRKIPNAWKVAEVKPIYTKKGINRILVITDL